MEIPNIILSDRMSNNSSIRSGPTSRRTGTLMKMERAMNAFFTTRSSCSLEECDQGFTQAWSLMFVYQMSVSIRLEDLSESYVSVLRNLSLF